MRKPFRIDVLPGLVALTLILSLTACASKPSQSSKSAGAVPDNGDLALLPDPVPFEEPPSRTGNPMVYTVFGRDYRVAGTSEGYRERGLASWYGTKFHGNKTSSGVPYDMYAMTAAHKSLPIPTFVRVTRVDNGRSIVVRVNDRGPFVDERIIDLSYAAATKLGMVEDGLTPVEVQALPPYQYLAWHRPSDEAETRVAATTVPARPVSTTASSVPVRTAGLRDTRAFVQVGAFNQRRSAESLRQRLSERLPHDVEVASSSDALHRVRIGPLQGPDDVDQLRLALVEFGIHNLYLTQD